MRQNFRFPIALLTAFSLLGIPAMLMAQQAKRPANPGTNTQPTATGKAPAGKSSTGKPAANDPSMPQAGDKKPPVADPVSPRLEQILKQWEIESAKIKSLHGKHTRREFNKVFKVEKVAEGEFFLETPDKGRIDMIGKAPGKGEVSRKKDEETGEAYSLEKGLSERWICTGEEIFSFNDEEKSYQRDELPENLRGKNIVYSPLPFLFGMKAEDAKHRFSISLTNDDKENETVMLKVVPRMDSDRQNYHEAYIILDTKRYIPKGVRLFDPHGLETIYMFKDVTINDGNFAQRVVARFRGNPYKPTVAGYTRTIPNEGDAVPGSSTGGGSGPIRQTGGTTNGTGSPRREANTPGTGRTPPTRTTSTPPNGKAKN